MTKQPNHNGDIKNRNIGTPGTNKTLDQNQGNRGWQMNPENPQNKGKQKN